MQNDPLYRLRHSLAGVALALLAALLTAAFAGRLAGDLFALGYGGRAAVYLGLLLYVVVGAVALFVRVARHETASLSPARVLRWFASLWLWPALLLLAKR